VTDRPDTSSHQRENAMQNISRLDSKLQICVVVAVDLAALGLLAITLFAGMAG
jgi:hypothetical protein